MSGANDTLTSEIRLAASKDEQAFVANMRALRTTGRAAQAVLRTDDRVLARITDGIYRQPSSALRELISNAYDADATEVFIETDAPRFRQIQIRDNGRGMTEEVLARMIHHIGGSSKRTLVGASLGTTDPNDPNRSPKGRKLIGKIGIGLFSVSQLTSHFQIITKIEGHDYRLFADVILKTYSEDDAEPSDGTFQTGSVNVVSVPADDIATHGTDIILLDIRPRARDILRSKDRWDELLETPEDGDSPITSQISPAWHTGFLAHDLNPGDGDLVFKVVPKLPWGKADSPKERFEKLFDAVAEHATSTNERPDLIRSLDTYLATLWALSLSAPVEYIGKHPFDLGPEDGILAFHLSNKGRGRADPIELKPGETVREVLKLKSGIVNAEEKFSVCVDQVELRRPINYRYWPAKRQAIGKPLLFVGTYKPDLSSINKDIRGGQLEYEGYLFWNSRIVPKENNGVLIRINGSSGALFDDTFMKYQVSEQTRLRQITSEIFVSQGLDAALNIDRESFNFAHPHYQILSNWVHRSLRQLTNTHKGLSADIRAIENVANRSAAASRLETFASTRWTKARGNQDDAPPEVEIVTSPSEAIKLRKEGVLAFELGFIPASSPPGRYDKDAADQRLYMLKAIATVLDGYSLLDKLSYEKQHDLLNALLAIYFDDAQTQ